MHSPPQRAWLLATVTAVLATASVACSTGPTGSMIYDRPGEGTSGSGDPTGSTGSSGTTGASGTTGSGSTSPSSPGAPGGSGGTTTTSDGGAAASGPPPSQPPTPAGFQLTIAPLLDAQGCTECHHHGRPIDVTTYPFMSGTPASAAQSLVTALTTNMPPAPRTAVTQTVIAQVNAWVAAGMKP